MEYYFDTDDKLERRKYAEFLKSMLENCDKYRREDSDGAYVIAIDSPWGTGKTRFAKMLRNYLEDRTKVMGDDSKPGKEASFSAIYYNSWETDFSEDALLPLVHSITRSPEFKAERFTKKSQKFLDKFKDAATAVTKVVVYSVIHNLAGETVTEMVKAADDAVSQQTTDPLESYQNRLNLLDDFRRSLEKVIEHTKQKKLVIIVDELDRCRPTFALQTLEFVKHLFAVRGLIFIFALDIKQLSNSVKAVYGQEMDAAGYLCRFFDYIGRIPSPDHIKFIKLILSQYDYYNKNPSHFIDNNIEYIRMITETVKLSLRDIVTVLQSYGAMIECFLGNYDNYIKHHVYLFLLVLKYKDPDLYNRLFKVSSLLLNKKAGESEKFNFNSNGEFYQYLSVLQSENPLKNSLFELKGGELNNPNNARVIEVKNLTPERVIVKFKVDPNGYVYEYDSSNDKDVTWGNVLFKEDFLNWDKIKELTLSEYFYSQLEMFNFALPADNTEPEA